VEGNIKPLFILALKSNAKKGGRAKRLERRTWNFQFNWRKSTGL